MLDHPGQAGSAVRPPCHTPGASPAPMLVVVDPEGHLADEVFGVSQIRDRQHDRDSPNDARS